MEIAKKLIDQLDAIKLKLTDDEYMQITGTIVSISKYESKLYEVTVYYPNVSENLIEDNMQMMENASTTAVSIEKMIFLSEVNFKESEHENINNYNKNRLQEMLKEPVRMCVHDLDIFKYPPAFATFHVLEGIANIHEDGDTEDVSNYTKINKCLSITNFYCFIKPYNGS